MGLEVYALVILSSLALFAVVVEAQNDFGEETSGPKGDKLPWFTYEIRKSKYVNSNPLHSVNVLFSHQNGYFVFFNQLTHIFRVKEAC